jgi:predicted nucleic acid-binding protein
MRLVQRSLMLPSDVPIGPVLLDTDVFSYLLRKKDRYLEFGALLVGHLPVIAFPTVGELRAGAEKAGWNAASMEALNGAIAGCVILRSTDAVIDEYAKLHWRIEPRLRRRGHNDMWIAACALAQPSPPSVMTNNLADFTLMSADFPLRLIHPDL